VNIQNSDLSALRDKDPKALVIRAFNLRPTAFVEGLKSETISVTYSDAGQATVIYANLGGSMDDFVSSSRYVSILVLAAELWRLKQAKLQWIGWAGRGRQDWFDRGAHAQAQVIPEVAVVARLYRDFAKRGQAPLRLPPALTAQSGHSGGLGTALTLGVGGFGWAPKCMGPGRQRRRRSHRSPGGAASCGVCGRRPGSASAFHGRDPSATGAAPDPPQPPDALLPPVFLGLRTTFLPGCGNDLFARGTQLGTTTGHPSQRKLDVAGRCVGSRGR
jgi:hypothetical protein